MSIFHGRIKAVMVMYLISLYFDDHSTALFDSYQKMIEKQTQQFFLSQKNIPIHMTLATGHDHDEQVIFDALNEVISQCRAGIIEMTFIGSFARNTFFLAPIYNEYLHHLSTVINQQIDTIEGQRKENRYLPFHWQPHITLARKLDEQQLVMAFQTLTMLFQPFQTKITRIALSCTKPYRDLYTWNLEDN